LIFAFGELFVGLFLEVTMSPVCRAYILFMLQWMLLASFLFYLHIYWWLYKKRPYELISQLTYYLRYMTCGNIYILLIWSFFKQNPYAGNMENGSFDFVIFFSDQVLVLPWRSIFDGMHIHLWITAPFYPSRQGRELKSKRGGGDMVETLSNIYISKFNLIMHKLLQIEIRKLFCYLLWKSMHCEIEI
jgi:hypothetical protein